MCTCSSFSDLEGMEQCAHAVRSQTSKVWNSVHMQFVLRLRRYGTVCTCSSFSDLEGTELCAHVVRSQTSKVWNSVHMQFVLRLRRYGTVCTCSSFSDLEGTELCAHVVRSHYRCRYKADVDRLQLEVADTKKTLAE